MNLQFKASALVLEQELNISFQNGQVSFAENYSNSSESSSAKTAPFKIMVTNPHCT